MCIRDRISSIDLTENDLLFITNGGCVESCTMGAQDKAAGFDHTIKPGNGWDLWKKIAAQDLSCLLYTSVAAAAVAALHAAHPVRHGSGHHAGGP